jgi:hypothetical protein
MNKMQSVYLFLVFIIFSCDSVGAQPKWELNVFGGASNYLGDLVEPPFPT